MLLKQNSAIDANSTAGLDVADVKQADFHSFLSFNAILPIALCFGCGASSRCCTCRSRLPLPVLHAAAVLSLLVRRFTITALVYMSAHISGGQINCCVTMALAMVGTISPIEAAANTAAQFMGSVLGAAMVQGLVPYGHQSALGSNSIASGIGTGEAFLGACKG